MREVQIDEIRKAYSLFEEEKSKYIFENRLMYSLTGAKKFIRNLVCTNEIGLEMYNRLKSSHQKKILFGAGKLGKRLLHVYEDIRFECFVDNFNRSQACCNLPVINFAELKKNYSDALISIVSIKYCDEMMEQLLQAGFEKKNILNFGLEYRKMNQLQYFDLPTLEESRKEVECFVDGGSYDGESTMSFVNWCKKARGGYLCMGT